MKRIFTLKARLYAGLWAVYSSYMAVQIYVMAWRLGGEITWARAIGNQFLYGGLWLAFTPLILWIARAIPFRKSKWAAVFAVHFILGIIIAVAQAWVYTFILSYYRYLAEGAPLVLAKQFTSLASFFDYGIHLYWLVIVLDYVYEYYFIARHHALNEATLEAQLAGARLRALTMQVRPHFLFNTLNAISVLIGTEPETARSMLGHLAGLLRRTIAVSDRGEIPLKDELEFLGNYLEIEKIRFRDRLSVDISVPAEILSALVPAMILQPLVENSVKHGVSKVGGTGTISISAWKVDGLLRLEVSNSGGVLPLPADAEGVGLTNTRARLKHLYGDRQEFRLRDRGEGGVTAEMTLPFHTEPEGR